MRVAGPHGVLRWDGLTWRLEPPLREWIGVVTGEGDHGDPVVLSALLDFAVHDLGSRGIGAILVHRTDDAGASWTRQDGGLPDQEWNVVLRGAAAVDTAEPAGVYLGTRGGDVWASADEGGSFRQVAGHLPDVLSVAVGVTP